MKYTTAHPGSPSNPDAPHAGARIEIFAWPGGYMIQKDAPHAGARIEIRMLWLLRAKTTDAPHAGARIEILAS